MPLNVGNEREREIKSSEFSMMSSAKRIEKRRGMIANEETRDEGKDKGALSRAQTASSR